MVVDRTRNQQAQWERKLGLVLEKELKNRYDAKKEQQEGSTKGLSRKEQFETILNVLTRYTNIGVLDVSYRSEDTETAEMIKIYNPVTWVWESPRFIFKNLLYTAIGNYSSSDFNTFVNYCYGSLMNNAKGINFVPEPYAGARYLMFDNGILDLSTMELIEIKPLQVKAQTLSGEKVNIPLIKYQPAFNLNGKEIPLPEIGFTDYHKLHCNWVDISKIGIPQYKGDPKPGQQPYNFNPVDWMLKTAGGEKESQYILAMIGALLVPNHQFNAFWEINGPSNSGKSTLINLVKDVYNNRGSVIDGFSIDTLSETFPFRGTVDNTTNVVAITEVNGASVPKTAISLVNQFANEGVSLKQLGGKSMFVTPPPHLVLEGAGWAHFDVTNTGVQRRIIPINLANSKASTYRAKMKKNVFKQRKFIECFVYMAVNAYAEMSKGDDNFVFQMDDLDGLPNFAQAWHMQAISAGDQYMNNFMDRMLSALHTGYLPLQMMHDIYKKSTEMDGIETQYQRQIASFKTAFLIYLKQYGFNVVEYGNEKETKDVLQRHDESELGIDFDKVKETMDPPDDVKNYANSKYSVFSTNQWVKIIKTTKEE